MKFNDKLTALGLTLLGLLFLVAVSRGCGQQLTSDSTSEDRELQVGDRAPNFALRDAEGQMRRLAEFRGQSAVALAFYPAMFQAGG